MIKKYSILLILPYFGKWPVWLDANLVSIAKNPTINWLIVTDCDIPEKYPDNICFIATTLPNISMKINKVVEADVPLFPIKFCDLKPAYGDIFNEYVVGYDFWGFCDMDIIWGDIRKFITDDILEQHDIISSRKEAISGHFNLFRNIPELNQLYKNVADYKHLFEQPKFLWFDESVFDSYIKSEISAGTLPFRVYWPTILLNQEKGIDSHQEYYLDKWLWKDGKMLSLESGKYGNEVMYLHFINWKGTMNLCKIKDIDNSSQFYVSYTGINCKTHSFFRKVFNFLSNLFNGYYKKERRRVFKKKIVKKVNRAINKIDMFGILRTLLPLNVVLLHEFGIPALGNYSVHGHNTIFSTFNFF